MWPKQNPSKLTLYQLNLLHLKNINLHLVFIYLRMQTQEYSHVKYYTFRETISISRCSTVKACIEGSSFFIIYFHLFLLLVLYSFISYFIYCSIRSLSLPFFQCDCMLHSVFLLVSYSFHFDVQTKTT